jgi:glycosyltransferase involved in cell wall biosynthesis
MLKVLYFTPNYPSLYNPVSGIMVSEFVKVVRELGVDLRVVHLDARLYWPLTKFERYRIDRSSASMIGTDPEWVTRFRVAAVPGQLGITWRAKLWHSRLKKHIAEVWPDFHPDIIHARTFIPCGIICEKLAEKLGCPLLICTHGADTRNFIKRPFTQSVILRLCERKKEIPIICVSEMILKTLVKYGAQERNLHIIYDGMDMSKIYQGDNPLNGKYRNKHMILGIGNLQPYKGFDIFIESIAQLYKSDPNVCGVIVGGGAEDSNLRKQIQQLGLDGVVELVGVKPARDVMEYMAACEIFCLPSWSEGFGIVYLEAMAHGKPFIAVDGQGITDVSQDNNVGIFVPPKDSTAVADAISKFITNREFAEDMGKRSARLIREKFSWRSCALQFIQFYNMISSR